MSKKKDTNSKDPREAFRRNYVVTIEYGPEFMRQQWLFLNFSKLAIIQYLAKKGFGEAAEIVFFAEPNEEASGVYRIPSRPDIDA